MPRHRLQSVVLRIATDAYSEQSSAIVAAPSKPLRPRSRSLQSPCARPSSSSPERFPLTPILSLDADRFWARTAESLGPSVVVRDNSVPDHLNSVLTFRDNCVANSRAVAALSAEADSLLEVVASLVQKHATIARHTAAFDHEAATLQLAELTYSIKLDAVDERLRHFDAFDTAMKLLRKAGTSIVTSRPDQLRDEILDPLQAAIAFADSHPKLRDIKVHRSRFHHALARALALIRDYLLDELRVLSTRITKMLAPPKPIPVDVAMYTEYNDFLQSDSGRFTNWTLDLARRSQLVPDHASYLHDVQTAYFAARVQVLKPYFAQSLAQSALARKDDAQSPMQRLASDVAFFVRVLGREFALYKAFFGGHGFDAWLKYAHTILEPLYDTLRPLILRVTSVSHLCQMALLMEQYSESDDLDAVHDPDSLREVGQTTVDNEEDMYTLNVLPLLRPLTDAIQSRLIFRTQAYVDNRLAKYVPTSQDLHLSQRRTSSRPESLPVQQDPLHLEFPENLFPQVYLPLAKALTLLQNIHELVNQQVFGDLAHYIVRVCVQFLGGPFKSLAAAHMGPIDALLYHLGLLILLKSQVNSYDIHYSRNDYSIDFTLGLSAAWQTMRQGGFRLSTAELLQLARALAPRIVSTMIDANLEIDQELNRAVSVFVADACARTCACLDDKDLQAASTAFKDNVLVHVPQILALIRSYIDDSLVIDYLMDGVATTMMVSYEEFYQRVLLASNDESRAALDGVMETDALEAFVGDIVATCLRQHLASESAGTFFGLKAPAQPHPNPLILSGEEPSFADSLLSDTQEPSFNTHLDLEMKKQHISNGLGLYELVHPANVSPTTDLPDLLDDTQPRLGAPPHESEAHLDAQSQGTPESLETEFEPPQHASDLEHHGQN